MLYFLYAATVASMIWLVITLIMGGSTMVRKGEGIREKSNQWMWRRVYAQGIAIALLFITFWVRKNGG